MAIDSDSVRRLVELVMQRLDASGPTDLVVKLGITGEVPNAPRLAANWIAGVNAPRFDYTMLMLSKAGLLTPEADRAWTGRAPAEGDARAAAAGFEEAEAAARAAREEHLRREQGTG